jgi:2-methylisocitrate lyase-like PEP mutase family enzyme
MTTSRNDIVLDARPAPDAADTFRRLHDGPAPLRLVNAWDAVSARVLALAGAPAIATSSFAVAFAHGYADGEHIPWAAVCRTAEAIVAAVEVPVSVDIEAGHGPEPRAVGTAVADVVAAGAVGINLEDSRRDEPGRLFDADRQCERIAAARAAGGTPLFLNARCDVFFGADVAKEARVDEAVSRAAAYLAAGADGIFLPGLVDLDQIRHVAANISAPLNVMLWPGLPPIDELAAAGVRRVSQGAAPFLSVLGYLEGITKSYLESDSGDFGSDVPPAFHLIPRLAYR